MLNFQGKTLQSLLACTTAEHAWMNSPAFSQALSDSTFDVRDLQRRKMTLYVVIPGHRMVESRPFMRTILTAILYAAFEAGPDIRRPRLRFYLDECATLGANLDLLTTLYTQGRKFGLRSINFFQSVGQVAEIAGGPEKVHNFRSQMAGELWKPKDFASAKEVSDWCGQTTVRTTSTSWQEGHNTGWSNSQGSQTSRGCSGGTSAGSTVSISETGVLAIRPEEILQLREREAIFVSAGTPPIKVNVIQAAEARGFGDVSAVRRQQQRYLFRVRCHAVVLLVIVLPLDLFVAVWLLTSGVTKWSLAGDLGAILKSDVAMQILLSALEHPTSRDRSRVVKYRRQGSEERAVFRGGIVCISNRELHDDELLGAFKSRVHTLNYDPADAQLGALMLDIADRGWPGGSDNPEIKPETAGMVAHYLIGEMLRLECPFDLRLLVNKAFPDYQQWKDGEAESDWRDLLTASIEEHLVAVTNTPWPQTGQCVIFSSAAALSDTSSLPASICDSAAPNNRRQSASCSSRPRLANRPKLRMRTNPRGSTCCVNRRRNSWTASVIRRQRWPCA
jgi:hypothetical protein